jgi:hypothetical protein
MSAVEVANAEMGAPMLAAAASAEREKEEELRTSDSCAVATVDGCTR